MVVEAIAIYKKIGKTYWQDAITKEMENVMVKFQLLVNGKKACNNYKFINCHIVL